MEEKIGESEKQSLSEETKEIEKIQNNGEEIQEHIPENTITQTVEEPVPDEPLHEELQIQAIEKNEIEKTKQAPEKQKSDKRLKNPEIKKKTALYPIPVTRVGFFLRGILAIALGALMFLYQDSALSMLGILLGCAVIIVSMLNLFIGYKERFREFYAKWLVIAGVIGLILGIIIACVPLLLSPLIFLFLTLALVILGCADIILAIYLRKIPGVRGALLLLGLLSIAAGTLIYMYPSNLITFFCIYAIASGVLSIAISLFMKK